MTVSLRGMGTTVAAPTGEIVCVAAPCPGSITPLPPITSDSNTSHFQYGVDPVTGCPLAPDGPVQINYCKWWEKISADLIEEPGGGNKYGHCRCEPNWMKIGGVAVGVMLLMGMLKR